MSSINDALRRAAQSGDGPIPRPYHGTARSFAPRARAILWPAALILAVAAVGVWWLLNHSPDHPAGKVRPSRHVSTPPAPAVETVKKPKAGKPAPQKKTTAQSEPPPISEQKPVSVQGAAWPDAATVTPETRTVETRSPADLFQAGLAAQEQGWIEKAARLYQEAVRLDPNMTAAYLNLGLIYFHHQQDPDRAGEMFQHALRLDSGNKLAHNNMGVIHLRRGELGPAEARFASAMEIDPTYVDALYNMACVAARQGRSSLALSYLLKAGRQRPEVTAWAREDEDLRTLRNLPEFKRFIRAAPGVSP